MLGGFSLWEEEHLLASNKEKNGKIWNLLAYLIFNRNRALSPAELPELLCRDEKIEDPVNTVKNLVYRLRKQLQDYGLEGNYCILQQGGTYGWNPAVPLQLDLEDFVWLYRQANQENIEKKRWTFIFGQQSFMKVHSFPIWFTKNGPSATGSTSIGFTSTA